MPNRSMRFTFTHRRSKARDWTKCSRLFRGQSLQRTPRDPGAYCVYVRRRGRLRMAGSFGVFLFSMTSVAYRRPGSKVVTDTHRVVLWMGVNVVDPSLQSQVLRFWTTTMTSVRRTVVERRAAADDEEDDALSVFGQQVKIDGFGLVCSAWGEQHP